MLPNAFAFSFKIISIRVHLGVQRIHKQGEWGRMNGFFSFVFRLEWGDLNFIRWYYSGCLLALNNYKCSNAFTDFGVKEIEVIYPT